MARMISSGSLLAACTGVPGPGWPRPKFPASSVIKRLAKANTLPRRSGRHGDEKRVMGQNGSIVRFGSPLICANDQNKTVLSRMLFVPEADLTSLVLAAVDLDEVEPCCTQTLGVD